MTPADLPKLAAEVAPPLRGSEPVFEVHEGRPWACWRLTGLAEFIARHDTPQARANRIKDFERQKRRTKEGLPWSGTNTYEEALGLAKAGWPEGRDKFESALAHVSLRLPEQADASSARWSDEGLFFDVGAHLTDAPDCWFFAPPMPVRKAWKVSCQFNVLGHITQSQMMLRGAAAVALCKTLEAAGQIVELEGIVSCRPIAHSPTFGEVSALVTVPLGLTPLDLGSAAYVLAHLSSARRFSFALRSGGFSSKTFEDGFGQPVQAPGHKTDIAQQTIHLGTRELFENEREAQDWLAATISSIERA